MVFETGQEMKLNESYLENNTIEMSREEMNKCLHGRSGNLYFHDGLGKHIIQWTDENVYLVLDVSEVIKVKRYGTA
jgi:hypothetical protein